MIKETLLQSMKWRNIGPHRGGRAIAVAGDPLNSQVFYFGCVGGVWKTYDGGEYWENISDGFFKTSAVGALDVSRSDPNVIYVGMGESCTAVPRFHWTSKADGMYKSTDAGKSWTNIGLENTRHISRIRTHPENPNLLYVAVLGQLEDVHPERGIYRSSDGGNTWDKILFRSDQAGAIDLAMDYNNPRILYASMWDTKRSFWDSFSVGPDSSIYKTNDGGDTWTELTNNPGMPRGIKGRIGITVSPADSKRIWAIVEAADGGVYRSDDRGETWELLDTNPNLIGRAHYYMHIFPDPKDPETVYVMNRNAWKSIDGGHTFKQIATPHKDNHELWIDPVDTNRMIQGNDGGACISFNGGQSWSTIYNQPTSEFYHVVTDSQFPYRVYGTQQDNTSISIPSRSHKGSIIGTDVYPVGSAESGHIAVRPDNPNIVYAGAIGSHPGAGAILIRYDHKTGQVRIITVWPDLAGWRGSDRKYRFQWDSPIVISPHNPNILYTAGNVLFRSINEGTSWEVMSPDLTRNDLSQMEKIGNKKTSLPPYDLCTIFRFAESPHKPGVFWVGTDDGLIQLSKDNGETWNNVTPRNLPEWSLISGIEISPHDPDTAYAAVTRYKFGDYKPYLYKTNDFGKNWTAITKGIPKTDFTRVIRADPHRRGLLYTGTENGVYVSFNDGDDWQHLQCNMPPVPIHDMVVKDKDLVVATHGRGFWILDDLSPLHQITEDISRSSCHLFKPRDAYRLKHEPKWQPGDLPIPGEKNYFLAILGSPMTFNEQHKPNVQNPRTFLNAGANPPDGVVVHYYLKQKPEDTLKLTFMDSTGQTIRSFYSCSNHLNKQKDPRPDDPIVPTNVGSNRFVWDMRYLPAREVPGDNTVKQNPTAPLALPGTYKVEVSIGNQKQIETFEVHQDPRVTTSTGDLKSQFELMISIRDKLSETHDGINLMRDILKQINQWKLNAVNQSENIKTVARKIEDQLRNIESNLMHGPPSGGQTNFTTTTGYNSGALNDRLSMLTSTVELSDHVPTKQSYEVFAYLSKLIDDEFKQLQKIIKEDIKEFNGLASNTPMISIE